MGKIAKIIICVVICLGVGLASGATTASGITEWYAFLNKPFFNPPNWIFAPVWTILYTMMGIAAGLVWDKGLDHPGVKGALGIFTIQFIFNAMWSVVFFGMRQPLAALFVIVTLWILIVLTIKRFGALNKTSSLLLIPYLLWVSFATVLNFSIWWLN